MNKDKSLELTVDQFIAHLPSEQHGAITYDYNATLVFLRERYRKDGATRRLMDLAARRRAEGHSVTVAHDPEDRQAALAIVYAVTKLADKLKHLNPKPTVKITQPTDYTPRRNVSEFYRVSVQWGKRKEWIDQYQPTISHEQAERFQYNADYDIGHWTFEEATRETGETAHFEASSRGAGFGTIYCDGVYIDTVKCWYENPKEDAEYEDELLDVGCGRKYREIYQMYLAAQARKKAA